ncbi:hypothetical protein FRB90_007719, partial [Tulasnella sp. 427]
MSTAERSSASEVAVSHQDEALAQTSKWTSPPPECLSSVFETGLEDLFIEAFEVEKPDDADICKYIS